MSPTVRRLGIFVLLLGVMLAVVVGPGSSATPGEPVCEACGASFESAADRHDTKVAVERSTATVWLHENGSATWVVRNRLASGGDRLRANATLRAAIGASLFAEGTFRGSRVSDDGVVTLRYQHPTFARRTLGGTLYSGRFTGSYGYENRRGLGAQRVTVVAPEGTQFDRTVPGATVSENGRRMTLTSMERESLVTVVPRDSPLAPVSTWLALLWAGGPIVLVNVGTLVAVPALVGAGLVSLASYELSQRQELLSTHVDPTGPRLSVFGGALALLSLAAGVAGSVGTATRSGFGAGVAVAAVGAVLGRLADNEAVSYRVLVGVAVGGVGVASAAATGLAAVTGPVGVRPAPLLFLCPLFALLPAGFAFGRGRRRLVALAVGAGVGLPPLATVPLAQSLPFGVLVAVFLLLVVVATLVVGAPLLAVGIVLGRTGERPSD